MTKYREILRLKSLGFSDRNIARSCSVSRNTVRRVIDKANEMDISWPLDFSMTDGALEKLLFPSDKSVTDRRLPDYDYIRKELLRNGVTKKLLWIEYCEECRQADEEPRRRSLFLGEGQSLLAPLPATPFELAEWKIATVQFNYHIAVDGMFYSVPHQYIKDKVDVRVTDTTIEIFYHHDRIASHRRLHGRSGQYSTVTAHMPDDHQKYLEWNGDRFRRWADQIGPNTRKAVDAILTSGRVEQQSYRSCMGLLRLADKHTSQRLEKACERALSYSGKPSYKSIKNLITAMKQEPDALPSDEETKPRGITRGARYYGGNRS